MARQGRSLLVGGIQGVLGWGGKNKCGTSDIVKIFEKDGGRRNLEGHSKDQKE